MAFLDHPEYIKEFFQMQTEIYLKNLEMNRLYGLLSRRQFVTDGSFARRMKLKVHPWVRVLCPYHFH